MINKTNIFFDKAKSYISLLNVGTFLAIITPIAYLSGLTYYQGRLYAFGVEADIFPLSTQDIYVNFYYALMFILLSCLLTVVNFLNETKWCLYTIIIFAIITVKTARWYSKQDANHCLKRIKAGLLSFFAKYYDHESMRPYLIVSATVSLFSFFIYLLLAVTLCLWLPFYAAYSAGQRNAEKTIKKYRDQGCEANQETGLNRCTLVKDKDGKVLYEGILVAINDKEIAMFDKDGSHIFARQEGFILQKKLY